MDKSTEAISPSLDTSGEGLMSGRYYLMESMGDLLLITKLSGFTLDQPMVRRVYMEPGRSSRSVASAVMPFSLAMASAS